jgi:microcystin-dependent protein
MASILLATSVTASPSGTVSPYAGSSIPSGYLACDGSQVSRTTYANLFAAIGTAHGNGDGTTTFHLPDYRGRFLRGVDSTAGNDPDKTSRTAMNTGGNTGNNVGTVQGNATKKNGLALSDPGHTHSVYGGGGSGQPFGIFINDVGSGSTAGYIASSTTGVSLGGGDNETRPVNANVTYIIKT